MSFVKTKRSSQATIFKVLRQITYTKLFKKYSSGNFSYNKISINNLLFKENCLIVARFKDFLILDDKTEFIRRYYPEEDIKMKLTKILNFYEKYSKVFPNYLVLKENEYLYRNIRRKQKMIDAVNEIKMEEKENRRKLKKKENDNELFTKKIKNEIKKFLNNASFKNYYRNSFDSDKINEDTLVINPNSSMSIYNNKQFKDENKESTNIDSFVGNQTNGSITYIVNALNDNKIYTKDLPNIFIHNNNTIIIHKNQKITQGIEIKDRINNKIQIIKEPNNNIVKNVNNLTIKGENELQKSNKHIKNNSLIKLKKIVDKNSLCKYTFTSSNITNSSITLGLKNKNSNKTKSPFVHKRIKDNISSKNINKDINKENNKENNKDNNDINNDNIKIITSLNNKNSSNLYQKNIFNNGKNNFKKTISNKTTTDRNSQDAKENLQKNKNDIDNNNNNNKKEKYKINKEIVKKKYIKGKHMSQDFDNIRISEMTENLLNQDKMDTKRSCKIIINTDNINSRTKKHFLMNDNPNLITGDTKSNERNEKNFMEDNDIFNIRDIFINEKKETEVFYTSRKPNKDNVLKLFKKKPGEKNLIKELKFYELKNNYSNSIDNMIKRNTTKNDYENTSISIRNKSAITKQKTAFNFGNKKSMIKNLKKNTKQLFSHNNIKNSDRILKTSLNINNMKKLFIKKKDKDIKEIKGINYDFYNTTRNHKIFNKKERKSDSSIVPFCGKKIITERRMISNLSENNMKKNNIFFNSAQKISKNFKSKVNIKKNNNKIYENNEPKIAPNSPNNPNKKYKSFLTKKNNKKNNEFNSSSQKDIFSIDILKRIQAVKHNKTKTDFFRNLKHKKSQNSLKTFNSSKSTSKNKNIHIIHDNKTTRTPLNNKIINFFNNHMNKQLYNGNINKTKDEMNDNYLSSFSIKVNKTIYNKEKEKEKNKDKDKERSKNKNLKKTWSKNMKIIVNKINNNIHHEFKY